MSDGPLQLARNGVAGAMASAASTDEVSIRRSNTSSTLESAVTPAVPVAGTIDRTTGGPTVRNSNGPAGSGAGLPAGSAKPAPTVTRKSVADGSLLAGVKIAVVSRSQLNVPLT